jgi:hypothetical protein
MQDPRRDDLVDPYQQACGVALSLAPGHLADCATNETLRYLLATVAALRGGKHLADVLEDLDAISGACERCATWSARISYSGSSPRAAGAARLTRYVDRRPKPSGIACGFRSTQHLG